MTQANSNKMPAAWLVPRLKPSEDMSYGRTDQSLTVDLQAGVHWYPETTCDPDKGVTDRYGVTYFPKRLVIEPDLPFERIRASLTKRGFNTFEGDDVELIKAAANIIAEDWILLKHYEAKIPAETRSSQDYPALPKAVTSRDTGSLLDKGRAITLLREYVDADRAAHKETFLRASYYTWLRDRHWYDSQMFVVTGGKESVKLGVVCPSGDRLDTMIAEAIAQEKEKQ